MFDRLKMIKSMENHLQSKKTSIRKIKIKVIFQLYLLIHHQINKKRENDFHLCRDNAGNRGMLQSGIGELEARVVSRRS